MVACVIMVIGHFGQRPCKINWDYLIDMYVYVIIARITTYRIKKIKTPVSYPQGIQLLIKLCPFRPEVRLRSKSHICPCVS